MLRNQVGINLYKYVLGILTLKMTEFNALFTEIRVTGKEKPVNQNCYLYINQQNILFDLRHLFVFFITLSFFVKAKSSILKLYKMKRLKTSKTASTPN